MALGSDTVTTAEDQAHIGLRQLEFGLAGGTAGFPPAGEARVYLRTVSGKHQLVVRLPDQSTTVPAAEA